jgi:hypothetical protein
MCRRVQVRVRRTPYIYLRAKNLKGTATLTRSPGWQPYAGRRGVTDSRWELIVVALVAIDTQNKRYALRFIAVLTLAAACCAGLVGSIIWIISDL